MNARMEFLHGFVEYIHDIGLTSLLREEMKAKKRKKKNYPTQRVSASGSRKKISKLERSL
jgi:hypothetical protein